MKTLLGLVVCIAMLLAHSPPAFAVTRLRLGHASSAESSQQRALEKFAEDSKGPKVRSTPNPYHIQAFQLLGMNPSPLAIAVLYAALEAKAFDAQEHPLPVFWSSKRATSRRTGRS